MGLFKSLDFSKVRLHGRDKEIRHLQEAYDRVKTTAKTELVYLKGYSGSGKSALAATLREVVPLDYFILGKFDELRSPKPFSAIADAFSPLCKSLAASNDKSASVIKEDLERYMPKDLPYLTTVLPNLDILSGWAEDNESLAVNDQSLERANKWSFERIKVAFRDFIRIVSKHSTAIVLFIDDLQWADTGSLDLLDFILCDELTEGLLFIGAYRDNEVGESHALYLQTRELQKRSPFRMLDIEIGNLDVQVVNLLIADLVDEPQSKTLPLSTIVHKKTNGNAFFTVQFLKMLQDTKLLQFSVQTFRWEWDIDAIAGDTRIADNVVDLITNKIGTLSDSTKQFLATASCFGAYFELSVVATLMDSEESGIDSQPNKDLVDQAVKESVEEGLISHREDSLHFRFSHDRVQEAAYSLVPDGVQKQQLHLRIGRKLQDMFDPSDPRHRWIQLVYVDQLNRSIDLIDDEDSKVQLARHNLDVATRVASQSAFIAAARYLHSGLKLLDGLDGWTNHYDLQLSLQASLAEVAYSTGDVKTCSECISSVLQRARCAEDKYRVFVAQIDLLGSQNKLDEAVDFGLSVLRELGQHIPKKVTQFHVIMLLLKCNRLAKGMSDEDFLALPTLTDKKKLFILKIMSKLNTYCYLARREAENGLICLRPFLISIQHGLNKSSSHAFSVYAFVLGTMFNVDEVYRFGILALKIAKLFPNRNIDVQTLNTVHSCCLHLRKPLQRSLDGLLKGYQSAMEAGELHHAGLASGIYAMMYFYCGLPLAPLVDDLVAFQTQIAKYNQLACAYMLATYHQLALNLMGHCAQPAVLSGEACDIDEYTNLEPTKENMNQLVAFYGAQMQAAFFFDEMDVACDMAEKIWKYRSRKAERTAFLHPTFELILYMCAMHLWSGKKRRKHRRRARRHFKELELWLKNKTLNMQQKVLLVQAEEAILKKGHNDVRRLYDESILIGQRSGFPNDAALAAERAGVYCLKVGDNDSAVDYLVRAQGFYKTWGAQGKIDHIAATYPFLPNPSQSQAFSSNVRGQARFSEMQRGNEEFNPFKGGKEERRRSVYGLGIRGNVTMDASEL